MMKTKLAVLFLATCISIAGASIASAQGKGAGMGRGLGHAASGGAAALGRASSSSALKNAADGTVKAPAAVGHRSHSLPRDLNQFGGVAAGVGRSARGLERSGGSITGTAARRASSQSSDKPLANFERIQQHRLQQADHLRGIAEGNGNEHLFGTADRMEASANKNYQRQSAEPAAAVATPTLGAAPEAGSELITVDAASPAPSTAVRGSPTVRPKRGFWFRSR